jgi:sporulation protein YlmC with PRC-barrel domain
MAPDRTVVKRGEGSLFFSPPRGKEIPMELIRLERHQHPRPPHHELRQKRVLDIDSRNVGQVANLYVDDERKLQFVDVIESGFMGLRTKHHLVPVEAIAEEGAGAITLVVDQQAVESGPTHANPHAGPDEELQRSTREHFGYR